jgi:hypothetical protein
VLESANGFGLLDCFNITLLYGADLKWSEKWQQQVNWTRQGQQCLNMG